MKHPDVNVVLMVPGRFQLAPLRGGTSPDCPLGVDEDAADVLTCAVGLVQIREELRANGIDVYPQKEFDEDADDRLVNDKIRVSSRRPRSRRYRDDKAADRFFFCVGSTGDDPVRRGRQRPGIPGEREEDPGKEDEVGHHRG